MYLSEVRLINWRSYQDVTFQLPSPAPEKPLVLLGAMNGHGKTSLLLGLYFGMFGRFGTRFAEGFQLNGEETNRILHYRKALQEFRRRGAEPDEATEVHVTMSPSARDPEDAVEFRIERRWFFTTSGALRDDGETAAVYVDGRPQRVQEIDDATDHIETCLFPAHVLPAFFFDGEQAQRRIEESADAQMRTAVEVLYGTKLLDDLREQLGRYIARCKKDLPTGPDGPDASQIDVLRAERDQMEQRLSRIQSDLQALNLEKQAESERFDVARHQLTLLGLSNAKQLDRVATRLQEARKALDESNDELRKLASTIALPLALSRLGTSVLQRLEAERVREDWETLKSGTEARIGNVLARAFPTPDPLLASVSAETIDALRSRLREAIESIYQPPPGGCASECRYVHVRGDARDGVRREVHVALTVGSRRVEAVARQARLARDEYDDAKRKHAKYQNLPEEAERIRREMEEAQDELSRINTELGRLSGEDTSLREALKQKKAEIGRLETDLARMAPAQKRIEVVNRVRDVLSEFSSHLAPLAMQRLEASVTNHFQKMADRRFRSGTVRFREDGNPSLVIDDEDVPIRTMSGYERRTFGIAFSLALAEVSGFRAPLVIDTPLGNADSEYRMSLLKHIVRADLDQIVILTHDEEVVGPYLEAVAERVATKYLIRYEQTGDGRGESFAFLNRYFEGRWRGR